MVTQLVCDFGVDAVERVEALRPVEPSACRVRELFEVAFARVEHAQAFAQVFDAQTVEADCGVGAVE